MAKLFTENEKQVQGCSLKKVFLEISQNSQEHTCVRVSFLIMLQHKTPLVAVSGESETPLL